jgi:glutamate 5-kinase
VLFRSGAGSKSGTGGMRTKIAAAEISMNSGVKMIITNGRIPNVIARAVSGEQIGTAFIPNGDRLCGRKRWIAFGASIKGKIIVNDGAKGMIINNGKSVLAAGITGIVGNFSSGDMVAVVDMQGNQFARGFVNYSAGEIDKIKGKRSSEIESILGHKDFDEVIHRDNLVLQS